MVFLISKVKFDFTVHYPDADAEGLMQEWKKYAAAIKTVLVMDNVSVSTGWDEEIEQFLALIKLLPAKRGTAPALSFIRAIDRLIIHFEVSIFSLKQFLWIEKSKCMIFQF